MTASPPASPLLSPTSQSTISPDPPTSPTPSRSVSLPTSWTTTTVPVDIDAFTSQVGPTTAIPGSPMEVFLLFFTIDLLRMIVEESNRYGYCKRQKVIAYTKCMCDIKQCKGNNISTHIMIFLASVDVSVVLYGPIQQIR